MLMEHTLQTLKALRLPGMAAAFEEQQRIAASAELSFDERFSMLVDREQSWRDNRRITRLLREATPSSSVRTVRPATAVANHRKVRWRENAGRSNPIALLQAIHRDMVSPVDGC